MDTDFYHAEDYIFYSPTDCTDGHGFGIFKVGFNKNNKNTQQYFQEAFGFTLFAVIHCPRASSLS